MAVFYLWLPLNSCPSMILTSFPVMTLVPETPLVKRKDPTSVKLRPVPSSSGTDASVNAATAYFSHIGGSLLWKRDCLPSLYVPMDMVLFFDLMTFSLYLFPNSANLVCKCSKLSFRILHQRLYSVIPNCKRVVNTSMVGVAEARPGRRTERRIHALRGQ